MKISQNKFKAMTKCERFFFLANKNILGEIHVSVLQSVTWNLTPIKKTLQVKQKRKIGQLHDFYSWSQNRHALNHALSSKKDFFCISHDCNVTIKAKMTSAFIMLCMYIVSRRLWLEVKSIIFAIEYLDQDSQC